MKSGTTTLHHVLACHKNIFIPKGEVHFFSIDDVIQHSDFFFGTAKKEIPDYEQHFEAYLSWYESFFERAEAGQCVGEDSTVYLASEKAPARIYELLPEVKLIFLLRDPVVRTYSHYWHLVWTGRTTHSFEKMLKHTPFGLLQRSFYKEQLDRYLNIFPASNIKVLIFEHFINNLQQSVDEVCRFIGVQGSLDVSKNDAHHNKSRVPRFPKLHVALSRWLAEEKSRQYAEHLPGTSAGAPNAWLKAARKVRGALIRANLKEGTYPPMRSETRISLQHVLARKNKGLSELIGHDVGAYWPYMKLPRVPEHS